MAIYDIWFGTYSRGDKGGIFYGKFNSDDGGLTVDGNIVLDDPSYLSMSDDGKTLYAVSEKNDGEVASIDYAEKKITSIQPTFGSAPCHLTRAGKFIYCANYMEGTLSAGAIDEDNGQILPGFHSVAHYGKGVNPRRQEKAHVHYTALTPDGKYLAVCDLGLDKIILYPYDKTNGIALGEISFDTPAGAGPRHIAFSKDGKYLYSNMEMGNLLLTYGYNEGYLIPLDSVSTIPADFEKNSNTAAIHVSPDGKYVAVSNRGHDSIAYYSIGSDGKPALVDYIKTNACPRDFAFSPDGKYIIAASQNESTVGVYAIAADGKVTDTGVRASVPSPVCVLFA
jgi:3-carboxymuconate cyclase